MSLLFLRVAISSNFSDTMWWWAPAINSGQTFLTYLRKSSRHPLVSSSWASLNSSFNRRSVISGVSARRISAKVRLHFALFATALLAYFDKVRFRQRVLELFVHGNSAMRLMAAVPATWHRHVSFYVCTSSGFLPHAS